MDKIKNGLYKHFKGNVYIVIGMATNTETMEDLVIYHQLGKKKIWARPRSMWDDMIEGKKRFEYIEL